MPGHPPWPPRRQVPHNHTHVLPCCHALAGSRCRCPPKRPGICLPLLWLRARKACSPQCAAPTAAPYPAGGCPERQDDRPAHLPKVRHSLPTVRSRPQPMPTPLAAVMISRLAWHPASLTCAPPPHDVPHSPHNARPAQLHASAVSGIMLFTSLRLAGGNSLDGVDIQGPARGQRAPANK